jgi:hypothetical protein
MKRRRFLKKSIMAVGMVCLPIGAFTSKKANATIKPSKDLPEVVDIESLNKRIVDEFGVYYGQPKEYKVAIMAKLLNLQPQHKEYAAYVDLNDLKKPASEKEIEKQFSKAAYRIIRREFKKNNAESVYARIMPEIEKYEDRLSVYFRMTFIPKNYFSSVKWVAWK